MENKTCPVWVGYLLASPIRKLFQNPNKILKSYIGEGMNILDVGPAMGFFSIPMAKLTGTTGKVYCVDVQEKMLEKLMNRANSAGVGDIIEPRVAKPKTLGLEDLNGSIDFILAFAVVHELPDSRAFFEEAFALMKNGGRLLFSEPKGHVSQEGFEKSLELAGNAGFNIEAALDIKSSLSALLVKD